MRCPTALILRLHGVLHDDEEAMAELVGKHTPNAPDEVVHMECHRIRTSEHGILVLLQEIRPWEPPLCWCDRDKKGWEKHIAILLLGGSDNADTNPGS